MAIFMCFFTEVPADVYSLNVSPEIASTIQAHYHSRSANNLESYLGTIFLADSTARLRSEISVPSLWQRVRLEQPQLQFVASLESASGEKGAVHYIVNYLLTVTETEEQFQKQEKNIALLEKVEKCWRIRRVMAVSEINSRPQALNEQEIALWQQDFELIQKLLAIAPAPEKEGSALLAPAPKKEGSAPQPQDISEGLLLSYDFTKEPTENATDDLSGNGHTAQIMGAVWAENNGLYFDGKDDFIRVEAGEKIHSDRELTIVGEILPTSFADREWQSIVWKGDQPAHAIRFDNREFCVWLRNQALMHATSTANDGIGKGQICSYTRAGSVTQKRVFALVINSIDGTMKTFLDGDIAASQPYSTAGIRTTHGALTIGGGSPYGNGAYFRGYMRWLRIYGRALSVEEISQITDRFKNYKPSPWRDPYQLSDVVVTGGWASITPIQYHSTFANLDLEALEPGVAIKHGWMTHPHQNRPTEMIYRHDGTPLKLSGFATILDCVDRCGQRGLVEQKILGDGKELWNSGKIAHRGPGKEFSIDLTGVKEIRLVTTDGGNGVNEDWAAWLNLKISAVEKE